MLQAGAKVWPEATQLRDGQLLNAFYSRRGVVAFNYSNDAVALCMAIIHNQQRARLCCACREHGLLHHHDDRGLRPTNTKQIEDHHQQQFATYRSQHEDDDDEDKAAASPTMPKQSLEHRWTTCRCSCQHHGSTRYRPRSNNSNINNPIKAPPFSHQGDPSPPHQNT